MPSVSSIEEIKWDMPSGMNNTAMWNRKLSAGMWIRVLIIRMWLTNNFSITAKILWRPSM